MEIVIGNLSKLYSLISVYEVSIFEISRVDCMYVLNVRVFVNRFGAE